MYFYMCIHSPSYIKRSPIRSPMKKYELGSVSRTPNENKNNYNAMNTNSTVGGSGQSMNSTALLDGSLDDFKGGLLARLSRIERMQAEISTDGDTSTASLTRKIADLENTVEEMRTKLETQAGDMKEMQRLTSQNSNTLLRQNGQLNSLMLENDNRTTLFAKLDGWVRQGEGWRTGLDRDMDDIKSRQILLEKSHKATTESTNEHVSKFELEAMKDRVTLICNQAVSHGIAMWHEKVESQLRTVERQMASLRSGGAISVDSTLSTEPEIREALTSQQPSELMINSLISKQLNDLQKNVEDSITSHVIASMKAQLHDAMTENKKNMPSMVAKVLEDQNDGPRIGSGVPKGIERQVHSLEDSIAAIQVSMQSLRDDNERGDKDRKAELRNQERKVEEAITISKNSVQTIQDRAKNLEDRLHDVMKSSQEWREDFKNEMNERVNLHKDDSATDWQKVDTRLLMLEKITESMNEKMSVSKDLVQAYFLGAPEIKALQNTAIKVDGINAEVKALRVETKEAIGLTNRLDASTVKLSDFSELREKINQMHLINERLDLQGRSVDRLDTQLEDVRRSEVKLSDAVAAASGKMDECLSLTESSQNENTILRRELENLNRQCKDTDAKTVPISRLEAALVAVTSDVDATKNTVSSVPSLEVAIKAAEENHKSLSAQCDVFSAEIEELKMDMNGAKSEVADIRALVVLLMNYTITNISSSDSSIH